MNLRGEALNETAKSRGPQETAERRIWFDYLVKLNDRELQKMQASGATTWVLLAVLGGLLYRTIPSIPTLCRMPSGTGTMLLLVSLELNAVVWSSAVIFFIALSAFRRNDKARLTSILSNRIATVQVSLLWAVVVTVLIMQTWLIYGLRAPLAVVVSAGAVNVFWVANLGLFVKNSVARFKARKRSALPIPEFSLASVSTDYGRFWIIGLVLAPMATSSWLGLVRYSMHISRTGGDWLFLLGGATYCSAIFAIAATLFYRLVESSRTNWHLALEQRLVVENLSPTQVREQFVAYSLGISVGDWLQTVEDSERKAISEYQSAIESAESEAGAIELVPEQERPSRRAAAEKALRDIHHDVNRRLLSNKPQWDAFKEMFSYGRDEVLGQDLITFLNEKTELYTALVKRCVAAIERLKTESAKAAVP